MDRTLRLMEKFVEENRREISDFSFWYSDEKFHVAITQSNGDDPITASDVELPEAMRMAMNTYRAMKDGDLGRRVLIFLNDQETYTSLEGCSFIVLGPAEEFDQEKSIEGGYDSYSLERFLDLSKWKKKGKGNESK